VVYWKEENTTKFCPAFKSYFRCMLYRPPKMFLITCNIMMVRQIKLVFVDRYQYISLAAVDCYTIQA